MMWVDGIKIPLASPLLQVDIGRVGRTPLWRISDQWPTIYNSDMCKLTKKITLAGPPVWLPICNLTSASSFLTTSAGTQMATKAMAITATIIPPVATVIPIVEVTGPTLKPLADFMLNQHNSTLVPSLSMNTHAHWLLN
jgi:hypothetical protein